jgi:hypothetical protein
MSGIGETIQVNKNIAIDQEIGTKIGAGENPPFSFPGNFIYLQARFNTLTPKLEKGLLTLLEYEKLAQVIPTDEY